MSRRAKYSLLNIFLSLVLVVTVGVGVTKSNPARAGILDGTKVDETNSLIYHNNSTGADQLQVVIDWQRTSLPTGGLHDYGYLDFSGGIGATYNYLFSIPDSGTSGTITLPKIDIGLSDHQVGYGGDLKIYRAPSTDPTGSGYLQLLKNFYVWDLSDPSEEIDITEYSTYPTDPTIEHSDTTGEDTLRFNIYGTLEEHFRDEFGYKAKYYVNGNYIATISTGNDELSHDITVVSGHDYCSYPYSGCEFSHTEDGYNVTATLYRCLNSSCTSIGEAATSSTFPISHPTITE